MAKKKAKSKKQFQIAIVVAIILVASLFALFSAAPEQVRVASEDGLISLNAVARLAGTVEIVRRDEINQADGIMSPVYELTTSDQTIIDSGEVTFAITNQELDITEIDIHVYDVSTLSWEALPTTFDLSERTVSAPVNFSGSILIGVGLRN